MTSVTQVEEELAGKQMTAEELKKRQEAMAKNNALLFYQEQKAKRLKKIKSKAYHRHAKKQTEKQAAAVATGELDNEDDLLVRSPACSGWGSV